MKIGDKLRELIPFVAKSSSITARGCARDEYERIMNRLTSICSVYYGKEDGVNEGRYNLVSEYKGDEDTHELLVIHVGNIRRLEDLKEACKDFIEAKKRGYATADSLFENLDELVSELSE